MEKNPLLALNTENYLESQESIQGLSLEEGCFVLLNSIPGGSIKIDRIHSLPLVGSTFIRESEMEDCQVGQNYIEKFYKDEDTGKYFLKTKFFLYEISKTSPEKDPDLFKNEAEELIKKLGLIEGKSSVTVRKIDLIEGSGDSKEKYGRINSLPHFGECFKLVNEEGNSVLNTSNVIRFYEVNGIYYFQTKNSLYLMTLDKVHIPTVESVW